MLVYWFTVGFVAGVELAVGVQQLLTWDRRRGKAGSGRS
jgi:hypothetical protein